MDNKKPYVVGFDLGGTKVLATLFDRRFRILAEVKAKSKPQKGEKNFLKTISECFEELLSRGRAKRSEVLGIGVGSPGLIEEKRGVVTISPNISFMRHFPLAARIEKICGRPVVLGNDVNIGLFGEHQFGAAVGFSDVIGIFFGTGIGGAMLMDGKLYAGSSGGAGEIGHMLVDPLGPRCGCGRRGCFEALCSRLAIATEAALLAARQQAPHLLQMVGTDILDIKSGQLADAIHAGDRALLELIQHKAQIIGNVLADLVNLLNPQLIVLGGGLVEALPGPLIKEATRVMQEEAMSGLVKRVKVVAAKLGDRAIVMGAAKRALDRFAGPK